MAFTPVEFLAFGFAVRVKDEKSLYRFVDATQEEAAAKFYDKKYCYSPAEAEMMREVTEWVAQYTKERFDRAGTSVDDTVFTTLSLSPGLGD